MPADDLRFLLRQPLTVSLDMLTLVSGRADTWCASVEWCQLPPRYSFRSKARTLRPCSTRFFTAKSPVTPVPTTHTFCPTPPLPVPYVSMFRSRCCRFWLSTAGGLESKGRGCREKKREKKLEVVGARARAEWSSSPLGICSGVVPIPVPVRPRQPSGMARKIGSRVSRRYRFCCWRCGSASTPSMARRKR